MLWDQSLLLPGYAAVQYGSVCLTAKADLCGPLLASGTRSVRQLIQFSVPIRRSFTHRGGPGLVISAANLSAADRPDRSLQLCEE